MKRTKITADHPAFYLDFLKGPSPEEIMQRELLTLQIENERARADERSRNPKAEGAASKARRLDLVVIALLAADNGWLQGDLSELDLSVLASSLLASAAGKGFVHTIEPRQVKDRLERARALLAEHKRDS